MDHVTGRNRRRKTKLHKQPLADLAAAESSEAALAQIAELSIEEEPPAEPAEAALARFSNQFTMADVRRASVETAAVHAAAQAADKAADTMADSPAASSEAALEHVAAQLAALKRGGRAGIVAAFSLCSREYRDSFADPADFFTALRAAPAFADLLAASSGIVSAEPLSATIRGDEQRTEATVAIEVRIQGEEAPAGMPQRLQRHGGRTRFALEFTLELDPMLGWMTSGLGVVTLTIDCLQLGTSFSVSACTTDTLASIKGKLEDAHGIPAADQTLEVPEGASPLDDGASLSHSGVADRLTLTLSCSPLAEEPQPIDVLSLTGERSPYDVTASSTVATLKEAIFKQQGVPVERQVLVFGGKVLGADLELRQYNVWRGATVHLSVLPTAKAAAMPPPGRCTAGGGEVPWYAWSRAGGEAPGEGEGEPEGEPAAEE